jgi:hypothetical protein
VPPAIERIENRRGGEQELFARQSGVGGLVQPLDPSPIVPASHIHSRLSWNIHSTFEFDFHYVFSESYYYCSLSRIKSTRGGYRTHTQDKTSQTLH